MEPRKHKRLSPEEVDALEIWIAGMVDEDRVVHWADHNYRVLPSKLWGYMVGYGNDPSNVVGLRGQLIYPYPHQFFECKKERTNDTATCQTHRKGNTK